MRQDCLDIFECLYYISFYRTWKGRASSSSIKYPLGEGCTKHTEVLPAKGARSRQFSSRFSCTGEATTLLTELLKKQDAKDKHQRENNAESGELARLITLYKEANSWTTKREILSLFVNDYTKACLQHMVLGLSICAIDEARKHVVKVGIGKPVPRIEPITFNKSR